MIDDGAPRDLVHPGAEALAMAKPSHPAVHAKEDVLEDIVHVRRRGHPARDVRAQLGFQLSPRAAGLRGDPPEPSRPGFTASIVAEATDASTPEPGSQSRMNSRLSSRTST